MTEYWKSYAKKFCEICKCWYADNKISIERHEMGDRHKAMVQQRLREGAKKAKDKEVASHDLRMTILAMEQAARSIMGMDEGRRRREVPTGTEEMEMGEGGGGGHHRPVGSAAAEPKELDPVKEELREQKRKLKELKKKSKQSQLWVDDEEEKEPKSLKNEKQKGGEEEEETIKVQWVQAETPGGVRYYWHIFSGETRWDQPPTFYTADEYTERYAEIAAEIATQNHFIAASAMPPIVGHSQQQQQSSSTATMQQSTSKAAIAPHSAPQILHQKGLKREFDGGSRDDEHLELSKEERRRIKRERRAMAEAEGPIQMPDGLVEVKREEEGSQSEQPMPMPMPTAIIDNIGAEADSTTKFHPLGPWIPVRKEEAPPPKPADLEQRKEKGAKKQKRFDDLPAQEYGPGTSVLANAPAELLEIAEIDPEELAFKSKEAPAMELGGGKKKAAKAIGFRKPAGNSATKSLRVRGGGN